MSQPLRLALVVQFMVIPAALLLAFLLGVTPWNDFHLSANALLLALAGTLPFIAALYLFNYLQPAWYREIGELIQPTIGAIFEKQGSGMVVLVSLLAGFGEELLFRGVLQVWLGGVIGPWTGMLVAAIIFALLHYLSRAYFIYALLMGVYLGVIYKLTGNLLVVCLIHALYDWFAIRFILASPGPQKR